MHAVSKSDTLEAARSFPDFRKPVLIVWGEDDIVFPLRDAECLERTFPDARLERVARTRAFVPEDQPEWLANLIETFLASRTGTVR